MKEMLKQEAVTQAVSGGFATLATAFIQESLSHMVPWLIATGAVIFCDLCFGIRKSLLMREEVRVSKAFRRTMGKMVTYFSFVCMVCMVSVAADAGYHIDRWACLLVCGIEFFSIIGNILRPKGYDINLGKLLSALVGKAAGLEREDVEGIIEKKEEENEQKQ